MINQESVETFFSSILRTILALVALIVGKALLVHIPALEELWIKAILMSGEEIVSLIISLIIVVLLFGLSNRLSDGLPSLVTGFPQSGMLVASVARIIALIVAYKALLPVGSRLLAADDMWVYRVIFLLLMLYPIWQIARATYQGIDVLTELFTEKIGLAAGVRVKCPHCGALNESSGEFCIRCGGELSPEAQSEPDRLICPECGAENRPKASYCNSCGAKLLE